MPLWIHISVVGNGILPNEDFIEEVKEYFEEQKRENSAERNTKQISDSSGTRSQVHDE